MSDTTYTVRYTGPSRLWRNAEGYSASQDDPLIEGVSESHAQQLAARDNFRLEAGTDDIETAESASATTDSDVDDWDSWDEDDWYDLDYTERAEDVRAGRVDNSLDEIIETETSDTVEDAARDRRETIADDSGTNGGADGQVE